MRIVFPNKLKIGDEIRIIAPSKSMSAVDDESITNATKVLQDMGFKVTFGENVNKQISSIYKCASIEDRVSDLHQAFKDKNVKAILTVIGGFNVNQILDYIDYDLIKNNPKIICGYSDITALLNAIYAKTGLVTYYGPHFSSFGMKKGLEYTIDYFKKCLMSNEDIIIKDSLQWSDDLWFLDQYNRNFIKNEGINFYNLSDFSGTIVGGNLCTLNLLQGTEYMPKDDNLVLFLEDDDLVGEEFTREFDRNLQSLLHSLKGKRIKGLIVGRAQLKCKMTIEKWESIFSTKKELLGVPIIYNCDFGHTTPIFTFPIGGIVKIENGKIILSEIML